MKLTENRYLVTAQFVKVKKKNRMCLWQIVKFQQLVHGFRRNFNKLYLAYWLTQCYLSNGYFVRCHFRSFIYVCFLFIRFPFSKNFKFVCGHTLLLFILCVWIWQQTYINGTMTNRYAHIVIDHLSFGWLGVNGMRVFAAQRRVCIDATATNTCCHLMRSSLLFYNILFTCLKLCFRWFVSLSIALRTRVSSFVAVKRISLFCGHIHLISFSSFSLYLLYASTLIFRTRAI